MNYELTCNDCNKTFKLKHTLNTHIMIHTGEKPFKCDKCPKQFRQFSSLQKHDRTHTGDKPYNCQMCEAKFTQISNLKRHERMHKGDKPFQCEDCAKAFITLQNFKLHTMKHHGSNIQIKQQIDKQQNCCNANCCKKVQKYSLNKNTKEKEDNNKKQQDLLEDFFKLEPQTNRVEVLRDFFTSSHPQVVHLDHVDVLFNGRLYYYNDQNGKIEIHELQDETNYSCDPVIDHQHFAKIEYQQFDCSTCVTPNVGKSGSTCCQPDTEQNNDCCLACNKGLCKEQPKSQSLLLHFHGPNCGHPIVFHNDHIDYLVNDILHYPHDDHCDNHGRLSRIPT